MGFEVRHLPEVDGKTVRGFQARRSQELLELRKKQKPDNPKFIPNLLAMKEEIGGAPSEEARIAAALRLLKQPNKPQVIAALQAAGLNFSRTEGESRAAIDLEKLSAYSEKMSLKYRGPSVFDLNSFRAGNVIRNDEGTTVSIQDFDYYILGRLCNRQDTLKPFNLPVALHDTDKGRGQLIASYVDAISAYSATNDESFIRPHELTRIIPPFIIGLLTEAPKTALEVIPLLNIKKESSIRQDLAAATIAQLQKPAPVQMGGIFANLDTAYDLGVMSSYEATLVAVLRNLFASQA